MNSRLWFIKKSKILEFPINLVLLQQNQWRLILKMRVDF